MGKVEVIYDEMQHCTATRLKNNNIVEMDCPYTGKGEKFSPGEMLGTSVAGCMLIAIGSFTMRHNIDLTNTRVDVVTIMGQDHVHEINLVFNMPMNYSEQEKKMITRAGETCPIKHSFLPEVKVNVRYNYPE
jgi:uncharacterized OsmC-like protein